jgi:prolyl oligopeptidase family protein
MPDLSYDHDAPLNLTVETVAERPGATISRCEFDNAEGDRVVGYLVEPAGTPAAGVIYMHTTSGREGFLPEALRLAEAGGVGLCLQFHQTDDQVAAIRQSVQAIRRGADLLLTRTDRVACVGHSGGAMMASVVAGIDRRFRCFALEVGMAGLSHHYRDSQHPYIVGMRAQIPADVFAATLAAIAPYDAEHFIGSAAPTPLLFQFARFDIGVTTAESEQFYAMASEPKQQRWYDSGHVINDLDAYADRERFLAEHLELPDLTA